MASFPNLETARFVLRPLAAHDVDSVFSFYSDTQTAWFIGREPYTQREQAQKKVEADLAVLQTGEGFIWSITRRGATGADADRAIGIACLFKWNKPSRHIELGYVLGRPEWGKGVMSECIPPILRYGFEALELHRIEAFIDARNVASVRLAERCGFVREGAQREKSRGSDGAYDDLLCFGLLDREWRARQTTSR